MKKLILLMLVVGFSISFYGCEEDNLEEVQPKFDLPEVTATDGENEQSGDINGGD